MKKLDDFVSSLDEDTTKPKPIEDTDGEDDAQYWELMMKYKQDRRKEGKDSIVNLKKAEDLIKNGDVSEDIILAAAYM